MGGTQFVHQENDERPEQRCKLCGGFLWMRWCRNPTCKLHAIKFRQSSDTLQCDECKMLLELESLTNPCPECLKNEPNTILRRFERKDIEALKLELGIPSNREEYETTITDLDKKRSKKWKGYRIQIYGVKCGRFSEWIGSSTLATMGEVLKLPSRQLREQPWLMLPFPTIPVPEDPDLIVQPYRIRVFYENSALYLEQKLAAYGALRLAIQGLEANTEMAEIKRLWEARKLLLKVKINIPTSTPTFIKAAKDLGENGKEFSISAIADKAGYSTRSSLHNVIETFKDYEYDFEATLREVHRQAFKPVGKKPQN